MTMKPFAKRLLAAASAAAIAMSTIPAVGAVESEAQTWPMLRTISQEEQIPALDSIDPITAPLTRLGMAQLVMDSYRTVTGASDDAMEGSEVVFLDTEDADVLSAYQLDLVNGRTAGRYEPMEAVSRQDFLTASAMLLEAVGYPYVDDIRFKLNDRTVEIMGEGSGFGSMFNKKYEPTYHPQYQRYVHMIEEVQEVVRQSRLAPAPAAEAAPQAAPVGPKFCPNCGAPSEGGKFCQNCGSPF